MNKQTLIDFLKEKDALEKFKNNLVITIDELIDVFVKNIEIIKIIHPDGDLFTSAFSWDDTPEGFDYWKELRNEWHNRNLHVS